ncbi:MAG: class I SAM-dependent methyltransferase, partial [Rhodospirillales bacterium]
AYEKNDPEIVRRSSMLQKSRIFKEMFLFSLILEELAAMPAPKRLLEAGCGIGTMTPMFRALAESVVAFDLSEAGINNAKSNNKDIGGIFFCVADGTQPMAYSEIAAGGFDVIVFREFHPFTRDLYGTAESAQNVHKAILAEYARLLTPGGVMLITHAESKDQVICPEECGLSDRLDMIIRRVDPRLAAAFLFLTRNRIRWAMKLAKLFQPLLWLVSSKNVLYVLRKRSD